MTQIRGAAISASNNTASIRVTIVAGGLLSSAEIPP